MERPGQIATLFLLGGVHLALCSGLSAAMTIQAVRKGEDHRGGHALPPPRHGGLETAAEEKKTLRSGRMRTETDLTLPSGFVQPVIQGTADTGERKVEDVVAGVNFALDKFQKASPEEQTAVLDKVQQAGHNADELEKLIPDELAVLHNIVGRQLKLTKTEKDLDNFVKDVIDGWTPLLERATWVWVNVTMQRM